MLKALCTITVISLLSGFAIAQTPDAAKKARQAKNEACKVEAKSKNITQKEPRKAFMEDCRKRP